MELDLWNPQELLPAVSPSEVRFSRGLLSANATDFFTGLESKWSPFLAEIGLDIKILSTRQSLKPPGGGSIPSFEFEILGGSAVLYMPPEILEYVQLDGFGQLNEKAKRVFVEYLFRRFLASLNSCCKIEQFKCMFRSGSGDRINATSSIEIVLNLQGKNTSIWFGLSQDVLEGIDQLLRDHVRSRSAKAQASSALKGISMEICQLAVPPASLIDYIRPGTVIDLQRQVDRNIQLVKNGEPWLEGELLNCQGLFVARVNNLRPGTPEIASGMSRLTVELASFEMDGAACLESEMIGALINSAQSLTSNVALKVNGERIAKAQLAVADGHFVIKVAK